jgi:hypothetical protein
VMVCVVCFVDLRRGWMDAWLIGQVDQSPGDGGALTVALTAVLTEVMMTVTALTDVYTLTAGGGV